MVNKVIMILKLNECACWFPPAEMVGMRLWVEVGGLVEAARVLRTLEVG